MLQFFFLELHQTLQRKSVQQQIQLETSEKNRVKQIQNLEKAKVMEELQNWKSDKISFLETSTNCSSQEGTALDVCFQFCFSKDI